jgi:hypothetical protein
VTLIYAQTEHNVNFQLFIYILFIYLYLYCACRRDLLNLYLNK